MCIQDVFMIVHTRFGALTPGTLEFGKKRLGRRNQRWVPGTLNNHILMDVWSNNHVLCKDLESSN